MSIKLSTFLFLFISTICRSEDRPEFIKLDEISEKAILEFKKTNREVILNQKKLNKYEECRQQYGQLFSYYVGTRAQFKSEVPSPILFGIPDMLIKFYFDSKNPQAPYRLKIESFNGIKQTRWTVSNEMKNPSIFYVQDKNCKFRFNEKDLADISFTEIK